MRMKGTKKRGGETNTCYCLFYIVELFLMKVDTIVDNVVHVLFVVLFLLFFPPLFLIVCLFVNNRMNHYLYPSVCTLHFVSLSIIFFLRNE